MKEPLKIKKNDTRQIKKSIKQLECKVEVISQKVEQRDKESVKSRGKFQRENQGE